MTATLIINAWREPIGGFDLDGARTAAIRFFKTSDELICCECGEPAGWSDSPGVSHHTSPDAPDGIDHDTDANHVARPVCHHETSGREITLDDVLDALNTIEHIVTGESVEAKMLMFHCHQGHNVTYLVTGGLSCGDEPTSDYTCMEVIEAIPIVFAVLLREKQATSDPSATACEYATAILQDLARENFVPGPDFVFNAENLATIVLDLFPQVGDAPLPVGANR